MKTEAVMCMAFTRHSPSRTPLSATAFSTSGVMFWKSIRAGTFIVRYVVHDFMEPPARAGSTDAGAHRFEDPGGDLPAHPLAQRPARDGEGPAVAQVELHLPPLPPLDRLE